MSEVNRVLFSTSHLLHPTRSLGGSIPEVEITDRVISGIALVILGICTLGAVPVYYYYKAKKKIESLHNNGQKSTYIPPKMAMPKVLDFAQSKEEFIADQAPQNPIFSVKLDEKKLPAKPTSDKYYNRLTGVVNSVLNNIGFSFATHIPQVFSFLSPFSSLGWISGGPSKKVLQGALQSAHYAGSTELVPGSTQNNPDLKKRVADSRQGIFDFIQKHADKWEGIRVAIECNGKKIDAYIVARKYQGQNGIETNGRWMVCSNGHGGIAEFTDMNNLTSDSEDYHTNMIFYNYPSISCSEGETIVSSLQMGGQWGTRNAMVASHEAVMRFVEEEIKATEIIDYGISMGGGVQGHARKRHDYKPYIRYVDMSDQTYRTLEDAVRSMKGNELAGLVKPLGWQLSTKSAEKMKHPQIVIHKATQLYPTSKKHILPDGLFSAEGSLPGYLLSKSEKWTNKKFIGIQGDHGSRLKEKEKKAVQEALEKAFDPKFAGF